MLGSCNGAVVVGVVALHSGDVGNAHAAGEEGIFAVGLLAAAPARITEDVEIRGPEIEAAADAHVSFARILHVLDAAFDTDLGGHGVNSRRVEGRSQADGLGILGNALVDDAVERLAPPLVCGNIEPRNCGGVVLHLRRLLREGHAMHQVGGPLLGGQLWIHVGEARAYPGRPRRSGPGPQKASPYRRRRRQQFASFDFSCFVSRLGLGERQALLRRLSYGELINVHAYRRNRDGRRNVADGRLLDGELRRLSGDVDGVGVVRCQLPQCRRPGQMRAGRRSDRLSALTRSH